AEDGIRDFHVTGVQTCALPIFALRETVHRFVSGYSVFIEAARLVAPVEQVDVMAVDGKPMRAGEARRPCTDHGDALAGRRRAGEIGRPSCRDTREIARGGGTRS